MPYPLPEDIKKRAEQLYAAYEHLEVQDPGSIYPTPDGKTLVYFRDKLTGLGLWLEVY
jgi:hypothetical protein